LEGFHQGLTSRICLCSKSQRGLDGSILLSNSL
jgi:hypothetical protein